MGAPSTALGLDLWVLETAPQAGVYALALLGNWHDAEDVVQDCYGRLLAKASLYDLPRDGRKLLFAAIRNACANRRKEIARAKRSEGDHRLILELIADGRVISAPEVAVRRELERDVAQGLFLIPAEQRAALELSSAGYSHREIAEALGVRDPIAGAHLHRARRTLARYLAPYSPEEPIPVRGRGTKIARTELPGHRSDHTGPSPPIRIAGVESDSFFPSDRAPPSAESSG